MLRDTTSRSLYVRVWPPHTSERRGGGGGCEQEPSKFLSSLRILSSAKVFFPRTRTRSVHSRHTVLFFLGERGKRLARSGGGMAAAGRTSIVRGPLVARTVLTCSA